jgi:hypothetical protein
MRCRTLVLAACLFAVAGGRALADDKPPVKRAPTPPSQIGGRTLHQWLDDTRRGDPSVRQTAIRVLPGFGPPAVKEMAPVLLNILENDKDGSCRVNAASAVYTIADSLPEGELTTRAVRILAQRADGDPQAIVRLHAVSALGSFGNKAVAAIPSLINSMHDPNSWELRRAALGSLASVAADKKFGPNEKAVKAVAGLLLNTEDPERSSLVRMEAVIALGEMGRPTGKECELALQALNKSLRDPDRGVVIWANAALMRIDKVSEDRLSAVTLFLQGKDALIKFQAARALAALGPAADSRVKDVAAMLDDRDPLAVAAAIDTLLALGPRAKQAVPALQKVADNREQVRYIRQSARAAIDKLTGAKPQANANEESPTKPSRSPGPPDEVAGKKLKDWIEDIKSSRDPSVRETAIRAVLNFGKSAKSAAPALIALLKKNDQDAACRVHACLALSALANAACVEDIEGAVQALSEHADTDKQSIVRYHAVLALGSFGHSAAPAIPGLINRLRDPQSWEVRQAVVTTLGTVATPDDKIGPPDNRAVAAVAGLLLSESEASGQVRMSAVMALGAMGRPVNANELRLCTQALQHVAERDRDAAVRIWARVAFMAITGVTKQGLEEVAKYLKGKDDLAKYNVLLAFGAMGKEARSQIKEIIAVLNDRDPMVSGTAVEVLGGFGALAADAVPELEKLLNKKETPEAVKEAAKAAIEQIKADQKPKK